jgi:serine/threonine protein phosphatase PrpC
LFTVVPHDTIVRLLGERVPLEAVCERLIAAANDAGGPDNVTTVVIEVDAP